MVVVAKLVVESMWMLESISQSIIV